MEKSHKTVDSTPAELPSVDTDIELDNQDHKRMAQPQVAKNLDEVEIVLGKTVCSSAMLTGTVCDSLVEFLVQHCTTFAWSNSDMEGIDSDIITHQLSILPDAKPIRQKKKDLHS